MGSGQQKFHPNCAVCVVCNEKLHSVYGEKNNQLYCEKHFSNALNTNTGLCFECRQPLNDIFINAHEGKQYHNSCFTCNLCRKTLANTAYLLINERPFCEVCHKKIKDLHKKKQLQLQ